jgi:glycosyltransferase involved in cell wall biosynthesis
MADVQNVIVLSDYAFPKGGAEAIAINSSIELAKRGLNVHFFSAVGPVCAPLRDNLKHVHCLEQYDILDDPSRLRALSQGLWNGRAKRELGQLLLRFNPSDTVLHAHQWNKALTVSVFDAARQGGFETVATLHDYFIACPNGGFLVFPKNEICERTPLSADCVACNCDARSYAHKLWRVARHTVQNKVYGLPRRTRHCIYVSRFSRDVLKPFLPAETRWYHVSNPSAFDDQGPIDVAANDTFLFVGRLSSEKGVTVFAEAAREAGVRPLFVGDGGEKDAILQANPEAVVTGWLDRAGVQERYRQARALVFPSLWYECQPLVVLEALALGLPIIVSDRCAASEQVIDGENGFCFRRGSVADLAAKIRLLQDDATARRLSQQAYRGARANPFGMDDHIRALIDVYNRMLSGN